MREWEIFSWCWEWKSWLSLQVVQKKIFNGISVLLGADNCFNNFSSNFVNSTLVRIRLRGFSFCNRNYSSNIFGNVPHFHFSLKRNNSQKRGLACQFYRHCTPNPGSLISSPSQLQFLHHYYRKCFCRGCKTLYY